MAAGMVLVLVLGTWSTCAKRCDSLLEVREQLPLRASRLQVQVQMADKSERENGREGLLRGY